MSTRAAWLLPRTVSDGQTREDTRLALSGAMTPTGALTSRSGVIPGGGWDLVGVSAMQCKITTGRAFVQGTTAQGAYPVATNADETFTLSAGHATNPRIDLFVLRIYDNFIDASGSTVAVIEKREGTPAAVPTVPSVPAASIPLWEVRVPAGVSTGNGGVQSNPGWSAARTSRLIPTVAVGGIMPQGGPSWSGSYVGQYRHTPTGLEWWDGSAWKTQGEWTSYSATWDAISGAAPSLGNGSRTAEYMVIGKTCTVRINQTWGSTTTSGGAAPWFFGLPFAAAVTSGNEGHTGSALSVTAGVVRSMVCYTQYSVTSSRLVLVDAGGGLVGPGIPATWSTGNWFIAQLTYRLA
ncbi:hypothetical protein [Embleya sp. NPDC001921]